MSSPSPNDVGSPPLATSTAAHAALVDKYQRLAQEYTTLKAQNSVLRKGILTTQEQQAALENTVKTKDQQLRKQAQDMDLLTFHQERLTKLTTQLQAEITAVKAERSSSWLGGGGSKKELLQSKEALQATADDLNAKIAENETLHSTIADMRREHAQTTRRLEEELANLRAQLIDSEATGRKKVAELMRRLEEAQTQQKTAEQQLDETRQMLMRTVEQAKDTVTKLRDQSVQLETELVAANRTIGERIPFNDTLLPAYNCLNLPPFDVESQYEVLEAIRKTMFQWQQVATSLRTYQDASRVKLGRLMEASSDVTMSPVSVELYDALGRTDDFVQLQRDVDRFLRGGAEGSTLRSPQAVYSASAAAATRLFAHLEQLATLQSRALQEESDAEQCSPATKARNALMVESLGKMAVLCRQLVDAPSWALYDALARVAKEFSLQTSSKLTHENRHLASLSAENRSTNDQIVLAIGTLAAALPPLRALVEHTVTLILARTTKTWAHGVPVSALDTAAVAPLLARMEERARKYMTLLGAMPPAESVPYEDALRMRQERELVTRDHADLTKRIQMLTDRLKIVEQQKEDLLLEQTIHQAKAAEHKVAVAQVEAQLRKLQAEHSAALTTAATLTSERDRLTAQLGAIKADSHRALVQMQGEVAAAREDAARQHALVATQDKQLREMQAQLSDLRAAQAQKDAQLALLERQRHTVQADLKSLRQQLKQVTAETAQESATSTAPEADSAPVSALDSGKIVSGDSGAAAEPADITPLVAKGRAGDDFAVWGDVAFVSSPPVAAPLAAAVVVTEPPSSPLRSAVETGSIEHLLDLSWSEPAASSPAPAAPAAPASGGGLTSLMDEPLVQASSSSSVSGGSAPIEGASRAWADLLASTQPDTQDKTDADAGAVDEAEHYLADILSLRAASSASAKDRRTTSDAQRARSQPHVNGTAAERESSIVVTDTIDGATYPFVPVPRDQTMRESMIKKHFETKIQQLNVQLQRADGSAQRYKSLLDKTRTDLELSAAERARLESALRKANQEVVDIQDKLATTEKNYSSQLTMMTEHIFTLNSQLTAQQEELDRRSSAATSARPAASGGAGSNPSPRRVRS